MPQPRVRSALRPYTHGSASGDDGWCVAKHSFAVSPHVLREVWPARFALRNQRARGMPDARCTRSLVCAMGNKYAHEYSQQVHRNHPAFPAQWFTAYTVLSPVIGILDTVAAEMSSLPGASEIRQLDASVEASGPHVFTVRLKHPRQEHHPRPPHPSPASVTLRNAPLLGQDSDGYRTDLGLRKNRIFLQKGLDTSRKRSSR